MKKLTLTDELTKVASRVLWFEPPAKALSDQIRFLTYAMTYGTHEDMKIIRQYVSDEELLEALDQAPPGIFDARSWAYWNVILGRYPTPPLPERQIVAKARARSRLDPDQAMTPAVKETRRSRKGR